MREDIEEYPDSFRAVRGVKLEIKRRVTARLLKELPRPLSHIYITGDKIFINYILHNEYVCMYD